MRFEEEFPRSFDAAKIDHPIFSYICRETSKPFRSSKEQWTVHTAPQWSIQHLEEDPKSLIPVLVQTFQSIFQTDLQPTKIQIHRWRYALATQKSQQQSWWDPSYQIGVCGDWLYSGDIEGAFLSGLHLAGRIIRT